MKKFGKLLFQRMFIIGLCILLQGLFMVSVISRFSAYAGEFTILTNVIAWLVVAFIVSGATDPSYKIAWIVPILVAPIFGVTFYLLFGGNRLSKRLRRKMQMVEDLHCENLTQDPSVLSAEMAMSPDAALQSNYLHQVAKCPVYSNTHTQYYPSGDDGFAPMLEAIDQAKSYIFLEFFIIQPGVFWNTILEHLEKKAAAGLDVRVLYDDFGCINTLPSTYRHALESRGIKAASFNPFIPILSARMNNRDHRKFLICDGKVGFTGGVNLADEYINQEERFGHWKDCVIRLEGEAVWSMSVMFLSMWDYVRNTEEPIAKFRPEYQPQNTFHGFVQPFCDSPLDNEAVGETVYFNMITKAKKSVYIMTPYLIISDKMMSTLSIAAKNGIDVRIITPGIPDKKTVFTVTRAHYTELIHSGVKVYEYTPGFVHSKVFAVDDQWAVVGTVNFDFRSLYLHFEDGVWLCGTESVAAVTQDFEDTFPRCHQITAAECRSISFLHQTWRAFLRLLAPLM